MRPCDSTTMRSARSTVDSRCAITIEVRSGGPFIGFQQSTALLYSDDSIMLAMIDTDESVKLSADQPTKAVYTPLQINPQILLWDPERYSFDEISDIAASDATVLYFQGATYMDYLIAQGDVTAEQVDANVARIRTQLARFLDFESTVVPARLVNNAEWLTKLGAIEFMRDVGKHFTVNGMMAKESVKRRVESEEGKGSTFNFTIPI